MKRFKYFVGLALLLIAILVIPPRFVTTTKNMYFTTAKPLMSVIYGTSTWVSNVVKAGQLAEQNKSLRSEVSRLKRIRFEYEEMALENERLRSLLKFRDHLSKRFKDAVVCQVIGRSPGGWKDTVIIDKGSAEGLSTPMTVLTNEGLVGKVSEVGAHTSKVKLMTHPSFRVGALMQRSRHTGVVFGTADGECRMKYLALDADIQVGDIVETAGFSKAFPKGVYIGKVDAVWKERGQIYKVASIGAAADMNRLEEVYCIVP